MQEILSTLIKQNAKMNETILQLTMTMNQPDQQQEIPNNKSRCTRSRDPATRVTSDKLELMDSQDSGEPRKRYRPKRDRDFVPAMRVNYNRKPYRRRTSVKKTNDIPIVDQESAQPSMNQTQNDQIWIDFSDEFEKDTNQKIIVDSEPMTLAQDLAARILNSDTNPRYRISHSQCQKSLEQKPIHHTQLKSITERFKLQCDECQKFFKFQRNLDNHKAEEHTIQLTLF